MKIILLLSLMLTYSFYLSSCQQEDDETNAYLKKYKHYKPVVSYYMNTMDKELSETLKKEVTLLINNLSYRSCIYCTGGFTHEVSPEASRKSLLCIAYNLFKGKDNRLKYIFQDLFKTFYPEQYDLLLNEFNMQKTTEWSDMENEFNNLSMESLFNRYIEIEFERNQ
ncbi:MAG: hypothetical protein ACK5HT_22075 [Draconibacterium sp.]